MQFDKKFAKVNYLGAILSLRIQWEYKLLKYHFSQPNTNITMTNLGILTKINIKRITQGTLLLKISQHLRRFPNDIWDILKQPDSTDSNQINGILPI